MKKKKLATLRFHMASHGKRIRPCPDSRNYHHHSFFLFFSLPWIVMVYPVHPENVAVWGLLSLIRDRHENAFLSYPAPCLSTTCSSRWQVVLYPSNRHWRETLERVFPGGCIRLNLRHFLETTGITFKPQTAMFPFWHCCLYTFSKTVLSCRLYLRLLPLLHSTRLKVEWGKGPHFPLLFPSFPSIPEGRHRRPWTCSIKGRGGAAQQDMKPALEEDIEGGGEKPPRETEEKERILIACKR